ncbi:hypothetical protein B0O99DRAFT_597332 [Bisporella sp. PMI_857]|nr:hypothetical protein B0O99DRAFT_597332 [Bisporella sp. PMI_857]
MNSQKLVDSKGGQAQDGERLSPTSAENYPNRPRSASTSPSVRSNRSGITIVESDAQIAKEQKKLMQRAGTIDLNIKASRLTFLKGFFLPVRMRNQIAKTAELKGLVDIRHGENPDYPWIITVNVASNKVAGGYFEEKEARCTIDTGNLQGNFISKEFVIEQLGFVESDFDPLTGAERRGGTSASGHYVMPLGAVNVTWYHKGSTRMFRDMRFLVFPDPHCELVIGARSIQKHDLLSPPNLTLNGGRTDVAKDNDPKLANLNSAISTLDDRIESKNDTRDTLNGEKNNKDLKRIGELDNELLKLSKQREAAIKERDDYAAAKKQGKSNSDKPKDINQQANGSKESNNTSANQNSTDKNDSSKSKSWGKFFRRDASKKPHSE